MTKPLSAMVGTERLAAFGRGRQSLKESVWYSGNLLTFLATGEDTQGRFALIEIVGRKGNVPPPHIHHREDETFFILEGEDDRFGRWPNYQGNTRNDDLPATRCRALV